MLDDDGYLRIVDRKKELIITAGGKNISPANLEAALKAQPLIGQACVIGDGRPFIAALLVLDPEVAPAWAREPRHRPARRSPSSRDDPVVRAEVEREVAVANERVLPRGERARSSRCSRDEWLPDSEELTPTMKLKRRGIAAKYADEIAALYARVAQARLVGDRDVVARVPGVARLLERATGRADELGRVERVRRVAGDAGRDGERVADRARAQRPRTRSATITAPGSAVSSSTATATTSPRRHTASLSRSVRHATAPSALSACSRASARRRPRPSSSQNTTETGCSLRRAAATTCCSSTAK